MSKDYDITVEEAMERLSPFILQELDELRQNPSKYANVRSAVTDVKPQGLQYRDSDKIITNIGLEISLPQIGDAQDQAARCQCWQQTCTQSEDGCGLDKPVMEMQHALAEGKILEAFLAFGNSSPVFIEQYCAASCEPACVNAGTDRNGATRITLNGAALDKIGWEFGLHQLLYPETEITQMTTDKENGEERPMKIGIVGSGPAGFQAAWEYARAGYEVTIYEKKGDFKGQEEHRNFGGQWRNIPPWKARDDYISEHFKMLEGMGNVKLVSGVEVGSEQYPAEDFKKDHDIVVLAPGVGMSPVELNIPGRYNEVEGDEIQQYVTNQDSVVVGSQTIKIEGDEPILREATGITPALDFLDQMYNEQMRADLGYTPDLSPDKPDQPVNFADSDMFLGDKNVILIVGGLTGEDVKGWVARQVKWAEDNGVEPGNIVALARQPLQEGMSIDVGWPQDNDGLVIGSSGRLFDLYGGDQKFSVQPREFKIDENGHVESLVVDVRELENPHEAKLSKSERRSWKVVDTIEIPADLVIEAVGFRTTSKAQTELAQAFGLVNDKGLVDTIGTRSTEPGVYIIGDAATELGANPRHVLHEAMGSGKKAFEKSISDIAEGRLDDPKKWDSKRREDLRFMHPNDKSSRDSQLGI